MLDFNAPEFLVVAIVALLVIGPKDLPKAMRFLGKWVGKARGVARQFRSGFDTMVREAELAELEKQWAAENERIMREHPPVASLPAPQPHYLEGEVEPVMVEQPEIHDAPVPELGPEPESVPARGHDLDLLGEPAPQPKPKRVRKPKVTAPLADEAAE